MGLGQPMKFSYMDRPKRTPKENIRIKTIGFLTDIHKLMTRIKQTKHRETLEMDGHQLEALVRDQDKITDELKEAMTNLPKHDELGLEMDTWMRIVSGINNHRRFNINAINNIQDVLAAAIGHIQRLEGQDKQSAIEQWLDRILDHKEGYRVAHGVARGAAKAPPLPTDILE